jgi:hypothetical protein
MRHAYLAGILVLLCLAVPSPAPAQQGSDDLWEVTTKMEMAGMPFAMPPQSTRVCTQKGKQTEAMAPQDKECRMVDMRQSGNRTTFKIVCEGKNRMTGTADFTHGVDSYQGTMRFQGVMEGQQVDMMQTISGRRMGNCTWQDPSIGVRQMQKQAEDQKAQMCRSMIDKLELSAFAGPAPICPEFNGEFRNRVGQAAAEMRTAAGFDRWLRTQPRMQQVLQYGGHDPNAIWGAACNDAGVTRNWAFVANYCEAQARQIALRECAGRQGTNAAVFEYAPICMRYRTDPSVMQGGGRVPGQVPPARQAAPSPVPQPGQAPPMPVQYPPQAPGAPNAPQGPSSMPAGPAAAPPAPPMPAETAAPPQQEPGMVEKGLGIFKGIFGR